MFLLQPSLEAWVGISLLYRAPCSLQAQLLEVRSLTLTLASLACDHSPALGPPEP